MTCPVSPLVQTQVAEGKPRRVPTARDPTLLPGWSLTVRHLGAGQGWGDNSTILFNSLLFTSHRGTQRRASGPCRMKAHV